MARKRYKARLSLTVTTAARPKANEYTLWDGAISHFGLRVHPPGAFPKSDSPRHGRRPPPSLPVSGWARM